MSLLGMDVGTSATKGVLLDDRGRLVAQARRGYRPAVPGPGRSELDARRVWAAARDVLGSLARVATEQGTPVRAVCVGGSGDDLVPVDRRGRPVARVIMAADRRSEAEGDAIGASLGAEELYRRTGLWDLAATAVARFEWMRRDDPDRASRVARLLSWPEWIATRLGLPAVVDPTHAARTLVYDVTGGRYAAPLGLPRGLLSEIVPTGTLLGAIPLATTERLGLRVGTSFVVGGFDQAMATLGAGAVEPGTVHDGNGSWEAVSMRVPGLTVDPRLRAGGWSVGPCATDRARLEVMGSWMGGLALRWVVGLASGGRASDAAVGRALARLPSGDPRGVAAGDLVAAGTPPLGSGGAIAGLDLGTGHPDLVRAVVDGLAHRLRVATGGLTAVGIEVTRIRATGGGASSDRWLQLKADATGLPVERPVVREAGAFAAAVLAGSAVGVLPPADAAVRDLVTVERRFEPDPAATSRYAERAMRHRALADALEALVAS